MSVYRRKSNLISSRNNYADFGLLDLVAIFRKDEWNGVSRRLSIVFGSLVRFRQERFLHLKTFAISAPCPAEWDFITRDEVGPRNAYILL